MQTEFKTKIINYFYIYKFKSDGRKYVLLYLIAKQKKLYKKKNTNSTLHYLETYFFFFVIPFNILFVFLYAMYVTYVHW